MKKCHYELGCERIPYYNYKNELNRIYCSTHKKEHMINLDEKSKYCVINDCPIKASYSYSWLSKAIYCNLHKSPDIINVKAKNV